ncbi:ABC transporter ATP-binding protein [Natranaerobius trueperi]|uniref:ABC transporter ATP-binding protein n=1 Tax=Natranaerobius trueperi TaxID=759412 RepID=A0A226C153_9FIRM|nr:ABC transporter ATP-binding protein [Natranaerobius trueperi]OWZ84993.1 ABC transporter ATP-binding protein [Natranaerobius trueperi]
MYDLKNVGYQNIIYIEDLEIKKGLITSIVGESGSGKTTLLRLLNQLISHDTGDIYFEGENIETMDTIALRRKAIMLPQNPIIISQTIRDNLNLGLELSEKPKKEDSELIEALKFFNLDKDLDSDATKLSGGEKQRLSFARILLMDPEVFLLDEPSSALNEELEDVVLSRFFNYSKKNNKAVVMVTHSRTIAFKYSDEIISVEKKVAVKEDK